MMLSHDVEAACTWEARARKLGNVHPWAPFADLNFDDFVASAQAIAPLFDRNWSSLGDLILAAVKATRERIDRNTNLGIILLLAPLALAETPVGIVTLLADTTVDDAAKTFAAIRLAAPGGLGTAPREDVRAAPTETLSDAMALAANRDLIARQYAIGFHDIHALGVPSLVKGCQRFRCLEAAIVNCQLTWLREFSDSLIARKNGLAAADDVQTRTRRMIDLGGLETPEGRAAGRELDAYLRSDGHKLNPGTTADLVCASLFVALREGKIPLNTPFPWQVEDWL